MSDATWQALTWDVARVGGFLAYGLILGSVVLGLVLSLHWRSTRFPRFITNEMHRFVTLLSLVFIGVHGIAIAIDPFIKLTPLELLVPFLSHYRPLWMALGISAGYLALAVFLSERIRGRIGYAAWRKLHYLAFVVYGLATLHGLGTGSDTRTPWAIAVYGGGIVIVGWLLALRIRPTAPNTSRRRWIAIPLGAAILAGVAWSVQGPLAGGWSVAAGGTAAPVATATAVTTGGVSGSTAAPVAPIQLPFQVRLVGTLQSGGKGGSATLDATFGGAVIGRLHVTVPAGNGAASWPMAITVGPTAAVCSGSFSYATGQAFGGSCSLVDGRVLDVVMEVEASDGGALTGVLQVSGRSAP